MSHDLPCSRHPATQASCLAGASGTPLAYQECELVFQDALQPAGGVLVLRESGASVGSLPLGTAGACKAAVAGVWVGHLKLALSGAQPSPVETCSACYRFDLA